jgi:hypothetical protein
MTRNPDWRPLARRVLRSVVALVAGVFAFSLLFPNQRVANAAQAGPGADQVTFARDIAPILQRSCQRCHNPTSIAPMSLLTYEEVRPWARAIKTRTGLGPQSGVMPPWYIDKTIGIQHYKNDPSLSAEEIAKVAQWVDSGAPLGNPADMPPPLKFDDAAEWQIGQPDLILKSPSVDMKATAPDWWGDLSGETPTGLTEDRYVAAIEYKEINNLRRSSSERQTVGGRFIFHHLGVIAVVEGEPDNLANGFPTHEVGRNADIFEPNAGRLLKAGSKLRFRSAHLHAAGKDATSHIEIGFKLHPKGYVPTQKVRRTGLFGNSLNLDIKPMEANQQFQAFTVLAENAKIIAFEPTCMRPESGCVWMRSGARAWRSRR